MAYTKKQQLFIEKAIAGENLFLTGKAGTGKSYIVKQLTKKLTASNIRYIIVAPTGIAANNVDGVTIHSQFSIYPNGVLNFEKCKFVKEEKREVLRRATTIIVDEVSMLRPDLLDAMHYTLKKNGLAGLDERQIIFVGDLAQLPPILDDNERSVLYETYNGDRFSHAKIYKRISPITIELDEILRQSNEEFIHALNIVREGGKSSYFKQFVTDKPSGIILAPHNVTVKKYNDEGLRKQTGEEHVFDAIIDGECKPEDFNLERQVRVKDGCKIMYLVNSEDNPLRNGTLGIFRHERDQNFIQVGNVKYALNKVIQSKKKYIHNEKLDILELREIGSIEQIPIKLAYALSIHKSQGLTFDEVTIDLTIRCFQPGQLYVALSRVRTPEGLKIIY